MPGLALACAAVALAAGCSRASEPGAPAPAKGQAHAAAPVLRWETDESAARARAKREGRPLVIDFRSEWCAPCQELEAKTFADAEVARFLATRTVALRVDVTEMTDALEALMQKYRVQVLPAIIFLDAAGAERGRIIDYAKPAQFLARARELLGD